MSDEDPDRLAPAGTFWRWAPDGEAIEAETLRRLLGLAPGELALIEENGWATR